jgi:putative ABC transport system ATP-binding protein
MAATPELAASPHTAPAPHPPPRVVFEIKGLTKVYGSGETEVHALRGIDLELYASEMIVLLGPSGSGKSTLFNIMGGLDRATAGAVLFEGTNLVTADDSTLTHYRRDHVGFVFQFYNLIPSLTARENVALVTEIAPDPMTAEEALGLVGLDHRLDHFPAQMSGGEQQRVAIARAIAKRPAVLLCDEPTGALDSQTGIVVLEAIERVARELGALTGLITHNAGIAAMADRVIDFADGRVHQIRENPERRPAAELSW